MNDPFLINKRNKDIYDMRNDGATYEAIATKYGVTRERVRQLYEKYKRKLNNIQHKELFGTRETVTKLRHQYLILYDLSERRRKFKDNEEADKMILQKLSNLIEVYGEVIT
jgi:DNA-binding CsgD family transcriptional regulator